jgi:hypothetical protein
MAAFDAQGAGVFDAIDLHGRPSRFWQLVAYIDPRDGTFEDRRRVLRCKLVALTAGLVIAGCIWALATLTRDDPGVAYAMAGTGVCVALAAAIARFTGAWRAAGCCIIAATLLGFSIATELSRQGLGIGALQPTVTTVAALIIVFVAGLTLPPAWTWVVTGLAIVGLLLYGPMLPILPIQHAPDPVARAATSNGGSGPEAIPSGAARQGWGSAVVAIGLLGVSLGALMRLVERILRAPYGAALSVQALDALLLEFAGAIRALVEQEALDPPPQLTIPWGVPFAAQRRLVNRALLELWRATRAQVEDARRAQATSGIAHAELVKAVAEAGSRLERLSLQVRSARDPRRVNPATLTLVPTGVGSVDRLLTVANQLTQHLLGVAPRTIPHAPQATPAATGPTGRGDGVDGAGWPAAPEWATATSSPARDDQLLGGTTTPPDAPGAPGWAWPRLFDDPAAVSEAPTWILEAVQHRPSGLGR